MKRPLTGLAIVVGFCATLIASAQEEGAGGIFVAKCAKCHGQDGVPKKIAKGAPNFNDPEWKAEVTEELLVRSITQGKGKLMPRFEGKLSPEQIRAVAEYVRGMNNLQ